jgi:heptosyltransferase-2
MSEAVQKFYVIRFSSIGDIVLTTSVLAFLKFSFPNCRVIYITAPAFVPLLNRHPFVDEIIPYEKQQGIKDVLGLRQFVRDKSLQDGIVIDLHGSTRSWLLRCMIKSSQKIVVAKKRWQRLLLVYLKINFLRHNPPHALRAVAEIASKLKLTYSTSELMSFIERTFQKKLGLTSLVSHQQQEDISQVIIAPAASFTTKQWSADKFYQLCELILLHSSAKVVLVAGPEDSFCDLFNSLQARFAQRFVNLQGKLSLVEMVQTVAKGTLLVGNDSGPGHIAEALGIPIITIFGATHPDFGFKPHLAASTYITSSPWCSPCSLTGSLPCFRKEQVCMEQVQVAEVWQKVRSYLKC